MAKSETREILLKELEKQTGLLSEKENLSGSGKDVVFHGGDSNNVMPWNDTRNDQHKFAKSRLENFSPSIRERISTFNLTGDIEDVLQEIPVMYYEFQDDPNFDGTARTNESLRSWVDKSYTRTLVSQIYTIVSECGLYKTLWEDYKIIEENCFYVWLRKYPEFLYLMLIGKENFRRYMWKVNPDIKNKAINAMVDAISGKRKEVYKVYSVSKEGIVSDIQVTEKTIAPPKWAIVEMLGLEADNSEDKRQDQVTELTME